MDNDRLTDPGPSGGGGYDAALLDHWLAGRTRVDARSRRGLPRSLLPQSLSPIIKPLPAGRFRVHESNAEMCWEVMRGQGYVVPNADFFVRNHTSTPLIDAVAKALDDVILAYEMNGEPLPADHGFPVRVIVPHWAGIASVKWVGQIEVSATPLVSYWNTQAYRSFGSAYPPGGAFIATQPVRSAFELEWNARLPANQEYLLTGRSWSGSGPIARTEISTDGGRRWHPAIPRDPGTPAAWQRWEFRWRTPGAGSYTLRARATDVTGVTQPCDRYPQHLRIPLRRHSRASRQHGFR